MLGPAGPDLQADRGDLLRRRIHQPARPSAPAAADLRVGELVERPRQEPPVCDPDRVGDVPVTDPVGEEPPGELLLLGREPELRVVRGPAHGQSLRIWMIVRAGSPRAA